MKYKIIYTLGFIGILITFWLLRNCHVQNVLNRHSANLSDLVTNSIEENSKLEILLPEMIFLRCDSMQESIIIDSLKSQIREYFINKHLYDIESSNNGIFEPFPPEIKVKDKSGNYIITQNQLNSFQNHIQFLTKEIDLAVAQTKGEINDEIDRINNWVNIWIGFLALFGAIIPLFYNYKNIEELKEIKTKASEAENKANLSLTKIKDAENRFEDALKKSESAENKVTKLEPIVDLIYNLGRIKDIDPQFLLYNKKPLLTLKMYLHQIHNNLKRVEFEDNDMLRDIFNQLGSRLFLISPYNFIKSGLMKEMVDYSKLVEEKLKNNFTESEYDTLVEGLMELIDKINDA